MLDQRPSPYSKLTPFEVANQIKETALFIRTSKKNNLPKEAIETFIKVYQDLLKEVPRTIDSLPIAALKGIITDLEQHRSKDNNNEFIDLYVEALKQKESGSSSPESVFFNLYHNYTKARDALLYSNEINPDKKKKHFFN